MVLRGYDRIEVDEYIEKLLEENAALRRELDERAPPAPAAARRRAPRRAGALAAALRRRHAGRGQLRLPCREAAAPGRARGRGDAHARDARRRGRGGHGAAPGRGAAARRRAGGRRDPRAGVAGGRSALKKQATQEAARVSHLHRTTKDELRRLAGLLNAELDATRPRAAPPTAEAGDDRGHGELPEHREPGDSGIEPLTFPSRSAVLWPALVAAAAAAAHIAVATRVDQFVATVGEARFAAAAFAARGADFGAVTAARGRQLRRPAAGRRRDAAADRQASRWSTAPATPRSPSGSSPSCCSGPSCALLGAGPVPVGGGGRPARGGAADRHAARGDHRGRPRHGVAGRSRRR